MRKTLEELNAERRLGDAFFDYDQPTIRDDARPVLQQNAEWLRRSVKEYLIGLGIGGDRLLVVSTGEEIRVCFAEVDTCWQQNRRAHPIITAKVTRGMAVGSGPF